MEEFIKRLLASGTGTITGTYRLSPKATYHVLSVLQNPSKTPEDKDMNKIPSWFSCGLSSEQGVSLGIIDNKVKSVVIDGTVFPINYFAFFVQGTEDSKTRQDLTRMTMSFGLEDGKKNYTKTGDEDSELFLIFEYKSGQEDGNLLEHCLDYPFKFRATLSPAMWWKLLSKKKK